MTPAALTPGRIRRALDIVLQLPPEALADLVERLVDVLDAAAPDPDAEPERDACDGCDDFGTESWRLNRLVRRIERDRGAGDLADAEDAGDHEPDDGTGPDWQPAAGVPARAELGGTAGGKKAVVCN